MLLSPDEINKSLSNNNWQYMDKTICKTFTFETYMDGISFVNKMAELAEKNNHHPDIMIGWCKVKVSITSHEMEGVTTKCVNLATGIDLLIN